MAITTDSETYTTPPKLAKRLGVSPDKILHWIHTGQLKAINLALDVGSRPRWRIRMDEVERFELVRQSQPAAVKPKRRRRVTNGKQYF